MRTAISQPKCTSAVEPYYQSGPRPFLLLYFFFLFVRIQILQSLSIIVHFTHLAEGYKCNRPKQNSADRHFSLSLFAAVSGFR